jgi:hypothetical protein
MLKWKAYFKNCRTVEQFNKDGKERLFKEVLERQDELEKFELFNDKERYSVNLRTGLFSIKGVEIDLFGISSQQLKYRVIYYRRMQTVFTPQQIGKPKLFCYLLGLQTTVDDKNVQRVLQIYPDGKIVLQIK